NGGGATPNVGDLRMSVVRGNELIPGGACHNVAGGLPSRKPPRTEGPPSATREFRPRNFVPKNPRVSTKIRAYPQSVELYAAVVPLGNGQPLSYLPHAMSLGYANVRSRRKLT